MAAITRARPLHPDDPAAVARFQQQSREHQPGREDALLAGGYVRCGFCGHPMAVRRVEALTHNGQSDCFCTHVPARAWASAGGCPVKSNHVAVAKLDRLVWQHLLAGLKHPDVLAAFLTEASKTVGETEAQTGRIAETTQARLTRLEQEMAALVQQTLDPNLHAVARGYLTERLNSLGDELAEAKAHPAEKEARLVNQQQVEARIAEVKYTVKRMARYLEQLTFAQKRNLLFALEVQVYVFRGRDPKNTTDPLRAGRRYVPRTDFTGHNLGARLGTDWLPIPRLESAPDDGCEWYTTVITNNNASNYSIANAFDMQELLGLTVAGGKTIPEPIAETLAARAAADGASDDEE